MINEIFINLKEKMNKVIEYFTKEISVIRTGRASTNMLDIVKVEALRDKGIVLLLLSRKGLHQGISWERGG